VHNTGSSTVAALLCSPALPTPDPPGNELRLEYYGRLYRSNSERRRAFARWLRFYNHRRPHTSLDGLTPMTVLVNNAGGNHS
jgi:transposase InsO family protein